MLRKRKPRGLQRSRRKGDRVVSPNGLPNVYVNRPTIWGNPFTGGDAAKQFERSIIRALEFRALDPFDLEDATIIRAWEANGGIARLYFICVHAPLVLCDCNLVCWCGKRKPCHRNTLLRLADGSLQKAARRPNAGPRYADQEGGPRADRRTEHDPGSGVPVDQGTSGNGSVPVLRAPTAEPGLPLVRRPRKKNANKGADH